MGKTVRALRVTTAEMYPAYREGDVVLCDRETPALGDDIVVETIPFVGAEVGRVIFKRLTARTGTDLVAVQFNPVREVTIDLSAVHRIWRVIPNRELYGASTSQGAAS